MNQSQIASPCIGICKLTEGADGDSVCEGCLRKVSEIAGWANKSDQEKLKIIERINQLRHTTDLERKLS
jgi:hypothetical protein